MTIAAKTFTITQDGVISFDGTWTGRATSTTPVDKYGDPCGYQDLTITITNSQITGSVVSSGKTYTLSGSVNWAGKINWVSITDDDATTVGTATGQLSGSSGSGTWETIYGCEGTWTLTKQ